MALELIAAALACFDRTAVEGRVGALTVDRHARRDDETTHRALDKCFEQDTGAGRVLARVVRDLVHRLADADAGGEVDDGVDAVERAADGVAVANIADLQLDILGEVVGSRAIAVHLRRQVVERTHAVAAGEQLVGQVGADEPRTAGDQDRLRHRGRD